MPRINSYFISRKWVWQFGVQLLICGHVFLRYPKLRVQLSHVD